MTTIKVITGKNISIEDQLRISTMLIRSVRDNEELSSLGAALIMCAAARAGDTVLESSDYFRTVAIAAEKRLRDKWDVFKLAAS